MGSEVTAIIVAAGESLRMGDTDKILAPLLGHPVIARTVSAFQACPAITRIILVVSAGAEETCRRLSESEGWTKVSDICLGGQRRQDSVAAGLALLGEPETVIIHDGARPLVTADIIERGLAEAAETGAAVAAVPVTDTIKVAGDDRIILGTPPRRQLWAVQTPQVFRADIIRAAYRDAAPEVTDDATLVEKAGYRVKLYMGAYENIKITTPADLALAEIIFKKK